MGDKSVETLCNKIEFLSILVTFLPLPPKQCWFFYFVDCTDHSAYTTLNWGAGGIRELKLEANKIEQMLKYRKASFPKSVSTTFVAHCRPWPSTRKKLFGPQIRLATHVLLVSMKLPVLWSGLLSQVGASHRVNLIAPFPLGRNTVQEKLLWLWTSKSYSARLFSC